MRRTMMAGAALAVLLAGTAAAQSIETFELTSADGALVRGQADLPEAADGAAVVMVWGSGAFDRDVRLGTTNTEADLIFRTLAERFNAHGLAAVRFDRRGIRHGETGMAAIDREPALTATTSALRDDLAAVYEWTRAEGGPGARCVVVFGHSEGMAHIGRLASGGAPAPDLVLGMGALMQSPVEVLRWQTSGRDAWSLEAMDADGDGVTTNAEVEANWRRTPSSVFNRIEPLLAPDGSWTAEDIAQVRQVQAGVHARLREQALAQPDDAPYPSALMAFSPYEWWKSWFVDEAPVARRLAAWDAPVRLHYGELDSQTAAELQLAAAREALPPGRVSAVIHPDRGHSLGEHVLMGPIDEALADQLAREAAAACAG